MLATMPGQSGAEPSAGRPFMDPLLESLQHHGVPALIHVLAESFLEDPWRLQVLADKFPGLDFVALDGFSSAPQAGQMLELSKMCPTVTFDTGGSTSAGHGRPAPDGICGPGGYNRHHP